jgi:hypothetical protein
MGVGYPAELLSVCQREMTDRAAKHKDCQANSGYILSLKWTLDETHTHA